MKRIEQRLGVAGILVAAGIAGQLMTLYWDHPLVFLVFLFVASPLVLAGVLVYLWSLVSLEDADRRRAALRENGIDGAGDG